MVAVMAWYQKLAGTEGLKGDPSSHLYLLSKLQGRRVILFGMKSNALRRSEAVTLWHRRQSTERPELLGWNRNSRGR